MEHSTMTYYQDHDEEYDELQVDDDEEYQEDLFLQQHYNHPRLGGLGLVHDDDSDDDNLYNSSGNHRQYQQYHRRGVQNNFDDIEEDDDHRDDDDEEEIDIGGEDDYDEVDMDQHNIHLLSGSLSVRSPFLDAIREEEDEEPVFTKPSSYPSLGTGKHFHRLSGGNDGGFGSWSSRGSLSIALAEKQLQQKKQQKIEEEEPIVVEQQQQQQQQQQSTVDQQQQQQANLNNSSQNDSGKPRGPRPPLLLGRPRSNSNNSFTRLTTGFDIIPNSDHDVSDNISKDKGAALRETQMSPENPIQDLEVKRVLEGAALASASANGSNSNITGLLDNTKSADTTPLPSTSSVKSVGRGSGGGGESTQDELTGSFGHDTQRSIDDFFSMVKGDLDKRIQEAIQEVEQKFLHRVQKLEKHTAALAGIPNSDEEGGEIDLASLPKSGSLMESLTRPLPDGQNPGGSLALRKEILSHVTEKVGDLDLRVNQMEVLVSYKLVDIESKVQDLHGAHNSIAQKVHQVAKSHKSNMQGVRAGESVDQDAIAAEEARVANAMQPYRDIDPDGRGAEAFIEPVGGVVLGEGEGVVSLRRRGTAGSTTGRGLDETSLVDGSSSIIELRNELHTLGQRYQELNDGLLTDLMGQMRDAKLMLFQTVDEVDGRISKRVDRIEAEMHSKLLSEIEGRVQERVRAMEQTSSRLEKCFDKMEGRLGALETVLASRRPRPESMYQLLQQQLQQQDEEAGGNGGGSGTSVHAGTFAGFSSSPSSNHRSITSMLFAAAENAESKSGDSPQHAKPRRRTLAENGIYPENSSSNHGSHSHNNAITSSPLEGFVSSTQARPVWSPVYGISATSTSPTSPISPSSIVSSPLERGTVIGSRMGTIHAEYIPKTTYIPSPSTSFKEKLQISNPTSPIKEKFHGSGPTTPIREKFQNAINANAAAASTTSSSSSERGTPDPVLRPRRVSLSSFDSGSLSSLKPVRAVATTATATATATASTPSSTSIVTTTATSTTTIGQQFNENYIGSVKSSSSSLLTTRLNEKGGNKISNIGSGETSPSTANTTTTLTATKTMQRAMTFDTVNSHVSATPTIQKTAKTPVQAQSSYRELLHFWKAGGSGNNSAAV
ncbi:hypothetical protein BGZ76_008574 [Entomortierella beljakovae]|nr:hypothetical protein BGZ76_008574 [Entomortierella beljakovae]